jgi:hypothetical protein
MGMFKENWDKIDRKARSLIQLYLANSVFVEDLR